MQSRWHWSDHCISNFRMIVRAEVLFLHTAPSLHLYTPKIPLKALAPWSTAGRWLLDMPYVHMSRRATGSIQVCIHTHTHTHTQWNITQPSKRIKFCHLQQHGWTQRVLCLVWDSQVAQWVKNPPTVQETWAWSLDQEDPLEEGSILQYSCLENPVDRGAWCATIHRDTKNRTWLKHLSRYTGTCLVK